MKLNLDQSFENLFKQMDEDLSSSFVEVQKLLLKGNALEIAELSIVFCSTEEKTQKLISKFGAVNMEGKVVAFAGLSISPTTHSFEVNGQKLYTWCAADALIFPSLLDVSAQVESIDPVNGKAISLLIDRREIKSMQPENVHISWIENLDINNIRKSMCNRVHFFESKETAESWNQHNSDAKVVPVKNIMNESIPANCC